MLIFFDKKKEDICLFNRKINRKSNEIGSYVNENSIQQIHFIDKFCICIYLKEHGLFIIFIDECFTFQSFGTQNMVIKINTMCFRGNN